MRTILFGIEPTDPLTLVSVGVSLMLVALLAVTVPALRAMRVDPVTRASQAPVPRFQNVLAWNCFGTYLFTAKQ